MTSDAAAERVMLAGRVDRALATMVERANFWFLPHGEVVSSPSEHVPDASSNDAIFATGKRLLVPARSPMPVVELLVGPVAVDGVANFVCTNRIDLDYLATVLESSIVRFWLRQAGCFNGIDYRIDEAALHCIPITRSTSVAEAAMAQVTRVIRATAKAEALPGFKRARRLADWRNLRDCLVLETVFAPEFAARQIYYLDEVLASGLLDLRPRTSAFTNDSLDIADRLFSVTSLIYSNLLEVGTVEPVNVLDDRTVAPNPTFAQLVVRHEERRREAVAAAAEPEAAQG